MLREEQIDIRRQRAKAGKFQIENLGKNRVFSDYRVTNPDSGGQYTVAIRGFDVGDNTCTCPDFKSNTLGTCKHIFPHTFRRRRPPLPGRKSTFTTASNSNWASTSRHAIPTSSPDLLLR